MKKSKTTYLGNNRYRLECPMAIDPTLTIQPSSIDTYLRKDMPTSNFGSASLSICGHPTYNYRTIIHFDATELPDGATIVSATLYLYFYGYYVPSGSPEGLTVRAVKLRRTDWVELEATWNIYKTGSNWGTAGAQNTTTDIDTSFSADAVYPECPNWMDWDVKAHVEDAVENVSKQVHLLLHRTDTTTKDSYFRSRDYTTDPDLCPKLVIEYTAVAPHRHGIVGFQDPGIV